ncbi:MAG: long-chain fatty acid--CoA ligase [Lewinellaceae bacterium]|nr:long-chain fatty acid--CoA ligase [Lewinellaceae bacterium]
MEPTRLFDYIHFQKANYPQDRAFGGRQEDGSFTYYSTAEVIDLANKISRGLLKAGINKGDRIGVAVYQNRPEWSILDIGIQQIGAINVPVYPTISPAEYEYIFNDSEIKLCFVGKLDLYDKVTQAQANVPSLKTVYTFDHHPDRPYWEDIFSNEGQEEVDARMAEVQPGDLATIIYTSGTTGVPKGVMLSHDNIVSNVHASAAIIPVVNGDIALSFLPLCHIFERAASYHYTYRGVSVVYTGTDNLGGDEGDLKKVMPHFFTTVPRLLEKVYERIYNKGLELTGVKKKLFFWALNLTEDYAFDKPIGGLKGIVADKLIFSKWREALGGNVKGIVTGAAALPLRIAQVFSAAGIPIREGYGLTETSPVLTASTFEPGGAMLGTVGQPIPGVEIRIDESDGTYRPGEGEILAKGPNIMMGYYRKPEATAAVTKVIDGEPWFCTGDVGTFVKGPGGKPFLKITDRKKELLKTSGGKYVAPAPIENSFKESFFIEQMMVVGEARKFVSAIIVPAEEALRDWCKHHNIAWTTLPEMIDLPEVQAKYQKIIDEINPKFNHIEQIKKFKLVPQQWEPVKADGSAAELTPTMKLKRRVILDKYQPVIEGMYAEG